MATPVLWTKRLGFGACAAGAYVRISHLYCGYMCAHVSTSVSA